MPATVPLAVALLPGGSGFLHGARGPPVSFPLDAPAPRVHVPDMNALAICLLGLGSGFLGGLLAWWLARWFAKPEEAVLTTDRLDPAINWDDFSGRQVLHREVRGRDGKMHAVELVDPNAGLPEYER